MLTRILLVALLTIASAAIATAQTAGLKNYYNQDNKVGFKYPASWASGKRKWDVKTERVTLIDGEEPEFTVLVDLSNSNLISSATRAEVSLSTAAIDEATCKAMKIGNINPDQPKPITKKIGTRTFYYISTSDSGMGHGATIEYYRTFNDGRCHELAFSKYGSLTAKPDRAERALDQQVSAVRRSLYFGK